MSDITHSDYCPEGNTGEREDCAVCTENYERAAAYWKALYDAEDRFSRQEIEDAHSEPCERSKRDILLNRLGLEHEPLRSLREAMIEREK